MSSSSLAFNILIFSEISWQKSYRDCLQHYLRFSFHLEMLFISWNIIFTDPICVMDLLHGMNIPYMILFYQSQVQDDCLPSCHFLSIRNSRLLRDTFSSWPYGKIFIIILLWVCYRWINLIQTWFEYSFGDFLYVFVKTRWPPPLDKGFTMDHNNRKMNKCCFFLSDTNTMIELWYPIINWWFLTMFWVIHCMLIRNPKWSTSTRQLLSVS